MQLHLSTFALGVMLKKSLSRPMSIFFSVFSSSSFVCLFQVSYLSLIHFEFYCFYTVRWGSDFFFCMWFSRVHSHYWRNCPFPWQPCESSVDCMYVGSLFLTWKSGIWWSTVLFFLLKVTWDIISSIIIIDLYEFLYKSCFSLLSEGCLSSQKTQKAPSYSTFLSLSVWVCKCELLAVKMRTYI